MNAPHKSECPLAGGQDAEQSTDTAIVAPAEFLSNQEKQFATLRAQFAMQGHALHRTSPDDGPVSYMAERWGLVRYLPTLDDARRFLAQIGGAQ